MALLFDLMFALVRRTPQFVDAVEAIAASVTPHPLFVASVIPHPLFLGEGRPTRRAGGGSRKGAGLPHAELHLQLDLFGLCLAWVHLRGSGARPTGAGLGNCGPTLGALEGNLLVGDRSDAPPW